MKTQFIKILLAVLVLLSFFETFGQETGKTELKEKDFKDLFTKGDKYLSTYKIDNAIPIFKQLVSVRPNNANVNFKMGLCYLYSHSDQKQAIPYLKKASRNMTFEYLFFDKEQRKAPVDALYFLGKAYMALQQPDSAIKYLNMFSQENIKEIEKFNYIPTSEVFSNLQKCNFANASQYYRFNVQRVLLNKNINTEHSETNPVIFDDGKQMFYCSDKSSDDVTTDLNIYHSKLEGGIWLEPTLFEHSTRANEIPLFINSVGDELYLAIEDKKGNKDIFVSYKKDNKWDKPQKLKGKINSEYNEVGIAISRDLTKMLIASDRKGGFGGFDIYVCELQDNGSWGKPINLESINTINDEISPFFSNNTDTIFYTSNAEFKGVGLGGYDLYFTTFVNNKAGFPNCIKYPVNSLTHDRDFYLSNTNMAYLSSINQQNNYDIFLINEFTTDIKLLQILKPDSVNQLFDNQPKYISNVYTGNSGSNETIINEVEVLNSLGYVNVDDVDDLDKIIATEIVEKEVEVQVESIIETEKEVEKIVEVENIVEKEKEVERLVEVQTVIETEKEVERIVEINNIVEVEKIVEIIKDGEVRIEYVDIGHLSEVEKGVVVKEVVKTIEVNNEPSVETIVNSLEFLLADDLNKEQKQLIVSKLQGLIKTNEIAQQAVLAEVRDNLLHKFEFAFNSFYLTNSQIAEVKNISEQIKIFPDYSIEVVGHCDSVGTFDVNNKMSIKRARNVYKHLLANQIPKDRIIYYGKSYFDPYALNSNSNGRALNRRVEIILHTPIVSDK